MFLNDILRFIPVPSRDLKDLKLILPLDIEKSAPSPHLFNNSVPFLLSTL